MVEIRRAPAIAADTDLSQVLARYDELIDQLSPRSAIAVWDVAPQDSPGDVHLRLSDAYGKSSRNLSEDDLTDADRMLAKISRLVGDLVYQQCENLRDPGTLAHLASFTPGRLCERFADERPDIPLPSDEAASCAVLFADISGFTSLTERLARKGAVGAEELTAALNRYFGELIDIVGTFGGDVLKFAGDALLATFEDRVRGADLSDAATRAAAASVVIQQKLRDFPEVEGTKLSLKIALAAGDLRMLHIGGVFGRCELLMVGDSLKELGDANDLAGPGDIIAADSFHSRVPNLVATPLDGGNVRIESLDQSPECFETDSDSGQVTLVSAPFRVSSVAAMRGYIPAAIYSRLAAGHTDWLGELRNVTVVFANLPGFNRTTLLEDAQGIMVTLQQTLYRFEGSLNKLSVDDKGVSMLAGFGLPPVAHEDDAARAIGAALQLKDRINELGWDCSIGIATGRIFCGAYGNDDRREYTVIGDTVNTAARLMQAAKGGILCDSTTFRGSESQYGFDTLEPLRMKGKSDLVPCHRPLERRVRSQQRTAGDITIIGRQSEQDEFDRQIEDLREIGRSSVMLLEGEAGVGKSHLLNAFARKAELRGCRVLHGGGEAIERSTPWFAWRSVIVDIIGRSQLNREPVALEIELCERFELDDQHRKLLPLLTSVIPIAWADNEWTAQMKGSTRAGNTNQLLMRLIERATEEAPIVLVMEDAHYFDSASLNLLRSVATLVNRMHILAASRPLHRPLHKDAAAIVGMSTSRHRTLDALNPEEAVDMARHLLEADHLPRDIEQFIRNRTQGLPLYVEELIFTLRETGTIEVANRKAKLVGNLEQFASREVSNSLERVIVNRIDQLQPSEQLAIKVASVIGYEFSAPVLHDIFPIDHERNGLGEQLKSLSNRRLIRSFDDQSENEHSFRNRTTRDVAYNLVLVKHRTELHCDIATWIEQKYAGELDPHYPRLAIHWKRAGETARAIECLEQAGANALAINANQEAVHFFRDCLELESSLEQRVDKLRRAGWHRRYGEALYRLGDMPGSLTHLRTALKLFGYPDSETTPGQVFHGCIELARQFVTRIRTRLFGKARPQPSEALIESVRAYERLVEVQYQRADVTAFLLTTFRSLNLAERFGSCTELPRCYSNVSAMVSAMMLPKSADSYVERAVRTAKKAGDLSTTAYVGTVNAVHFISRGQWEEARHSLDLAMQVSEEIGDRRRLVESIILTCNASAWSGDWNRIVELGAKLREVLDTDYVTQLAVWTYAWQLWVETARDPRSEVVREAEAEQRRWLDTDEEFAIADEVLARGGLLFGQLRRAEWNDALATADRIEAAIGSAQPFPIYVLPTYSAMVDLYFTLCQSETAPNHSTLSGLRKRLQGMQRRLALFSLMNPIAAPLKCLADGRLRLLNGRRSAARRSFRKGLRLAEKYRVPYFAAQLESELANIATTAAEADQQNASASERFRGLGIATV